MFPDCRIFVGVVNQRSAALHFDIDAVFAALIRNLEADGVKPAAVADGEMARGLRSGIEVLMEPSSRRTVDASRFPFHFHHFLTMTALVRPDSKLLRP